MSNTVVDELLAEHRSDPAFIAEKLAIQVLEEVGAFMERDNVSRAELARRLSVSRGAVTQMFNKKGRNLTLLTLARLAAALDATLEVHVTSDESDAVQEPRDIALRAAVPNYFHQFMTHDESAIEHTDKRLPHANRLLELGGGLTRAQLYLAGSSPLDPGDLPLHASNTRFGQWYLGTPTEQQQDTHTLLGGSPKTVAGDGRPPNVLSTDVASETLGNAGSKYATSFAAAM